MKTGPARTGCIRSFQSEKARITRYTKKSLLFLKILASFVVFMLFVVQKSCNVIL
jgi:hypothetical protein